MILRVRFCLFAVLIAAACPLVRADEAPVTRVAFGSCAGQDIPQPFWEPLLNLHPTHMILLGDTVYADTLEPLALRHVYAALAAKEGFRAMRARCTIMATWDDHDYGVNDSGADHPRKADAQEVFLDFFGEPADSPRRRQKGIYHARIFGPPGRRLQVIMLDTRYFKSKLKRTAKGYEPNRNPRATFLGDEQWRWFQEQLRLPAELRLIGSSIQVAAEQQVHEKWANIPHERERLLREIRDSRADGVIVLSGDRHHAELSRLPDAIGYDLYDITSSSFNKPRQVNLKDPPEPNRYRIGRIMYDANFGFMKIDWEAPRPSVTVEIRSSTGAVLASQVIPFDQIRRARTPQ